MKNEGFSRETDRIVEVSRRAGGEVLLQVSRARRAAGGVKDGHLLGLAFDGDVPDLGEEEMRQRLQPFDERRQRNGPERRAAHRASTGKDRDSTT